MTTPAPDTSTPEPRRFVRERVKIVKPGAFRQGDQGWAVAAEGHFVKVTFDDGEAEFYKPESLQILEVDQTPIKEPADTGNQDNPTPKHYARRCLCGLKLDPYRIATIYQLGPMADHIVKKGLCAGDRGHKDLRTDIQNIIATGKRWLEMLDEEEAHKPKVAAVNGDSKLDISTSSKVFARTAFHNLLNEAKRDAHSRNVKDPAVLYLGRAEQRVLDEITSDIPRVTMKPEECRRFPFSTYQGLRIVCVDEESYIAVA